MRHAHLELPRNHLLEHHCFITIQHGMMLNLSQLMLCDSDTPLDVVCLGIEPLSHSVDTFLIEEVKLVCVILSHVAILLLEEDM